MDQTSANVNKMKYPELITFQDFLSQNLLKTDQSTHTIIDVRSPSEFAIDHIPGAINCPVLNDEERILVGTMYKQVNAFEAKKVGASLVAKNIGIHIENMFLKKEKHWKPLIYCWRGGNRSGAMAHVFSKVGWPVLQLDGGYKHYRQYVNDAIPQVCQHIQWKVISGATGSGKSHLLQALEKQGAQVLDLEKLANHRGSVLGKIPLQEQPSQKMFESKIWHALHQMNMGEVIFIEAESKKVGNLRLPDAVYDSMHEGSYFQVEQSINQRVDLLLQDYAHFEQDIPLLAQQLNCLVSLHGKKQIAVWSELAEQGQMRTLVHELLSKHYDPAYTRSHQRNSSSNNTMSSLPLSGTTSKDFEAAAITILASFKLH